MPQTPGSGGGMIGVHEPFVNGSYNLNGSDGPTPGVVGRVRSADSNGRGGFDIAVPAGNIGASIADTGGSARDVAASGTSSTRFAHRVRAVILPSVMTVSPFFNLTRFRVQ
jgi:hypothetical protein